jgi:DNA-binding ferritin-like protein (Dps family)
MNGGYELPRWESTDTAASYNYKYGEMRARMRQQLGNEASANALRIENVAGVLGAYSVEQMMSEYDPVTGAVKLAVQQGIVDASGDLGFAVRDAVSGAALYAAMADVRAQYTSRGPGLASIAAARATAADASRTSIDPATGLYRIGGAAVEYGKALDNLQGALNSGAIDADTFERAVEALGAALPGAAESLGTLEDAIAAVERASFDVGTAGLNSIRYYFDSLSDLTAEFAKAAAAAQEPIAKTTAAIGRLNSAQSAFGGSAAAALGGFGGGGLDGAQMLQNTAVMKDITRAQLIAEAAGIASAAMTTADAAAAAAKLAQSPAFAAKLAQSPAFAAKLAQGPAFAELTAQGPAFAELTAQGPAFAELTTLSIRDASLLLDGVGQYNAEGFERAFIRISDALAKGNVTDAQYKALFDVALDMFEGVPEETRTLIDSMTRLRDAMSGFADGLLIDEQRTTLSAGATLAEMQRQYAQAFAGAATGDNDAIGKYQQLANTLLDKELYSTQAEYNAAFGSVYGDARQLESIGINTLANAQGSEMVNELKDMNAKLNKRVEDLEKNLLAALAQIAKNTSDTSRGIEQQIVMAEDTP